MNRTLRRLLFVVLLLFGLLSVNSGYLGAITFLEHLRGASYQDGLYLAVFLAHLVIGLLITLPFLVFGLLHLRRAIRRPNRYAVRAGLALFTTGVIVVISGLVLTRFGFLESNDPDTRQVAYWLHVATPFVAVWLFVLHRLGGRNLRWGISSSTVRDASGCFSEGRLENAPLQKRQLVRGGRFFHSQGAQHLGLIGGDRRHTGHRIALGNLNPVVLNPRELFERALRR
jgi:hypothetical protein